LGGECEGALGPSLPAKLASMEYNRWVGDLLYASHSVHELKYHLVWSMKYRKNLLHKKEYQNKVKELIFEIAERYWYVVHKLGTDGDHIHIFLQAAPDDSVSRIV